MRRSQGSVEEREHQGDHTADPSTFEEVSEKVETGCSQQCMSGEQDFLIRYEESIFHSLAN